MTESVGYYRNRLVEEVTARAKAEKERDELQRENEQLRIHYESEKRRADDRAAENEELRAHVEALLVAADIFYDTGMADALYGVFNQRPAQSLHAIKAEVEEEVIERCAKVAWSSGMDSFNNGYKLKETREQGSACAADIRNMPRKYKGE